MPEERVVGRQATLPRTGPGERAKPRSDGSHNSGEMRRSLPGHHSHVQTHPVRASLCDFSSFTRLHNPNHGSGLECFLCPQNGPSYPVAVNALYSCPWPLQTCLLALQICLLWTLQISGAMQRVAFCGFFHLHVFQVIFVALPPFSQLNNTSLHGHSTFVSHSPVDVPSEDFVTVPCDTFTLLSICTRREWLGRRLSLCLTF